MGSLTALGQAIHLTGPNKPIVFAVLTMMKFAAGMAIFAATSIRHLLVIYDRRAKLAGSAAAALFLGADQGIVLWSASLLGVLTISLTLWG